MSRSNSAKTASIPARARPLGVVSSNFSALPCSKSTDDVILVVLNFTPVVREGYRIGVPAAGFWKESLNSDAHSYGGGGWGNLGGVEAAPVRAHGRPHSLTVTLPPLSAVFFTCDTAD